MSLLKKILPNKFKLEVKYFLLRVLKIPYSRYGVALEILRWLPQNTPISFIDIGANTGSFSTGICAEYQVSKALLIEPIPALAPILEKSFPDKETFKVLTAAVSDTNGETTFYLSEDFYAVSSLLKVQTENDALKPLNLKTPSAITVNTFTLDHLCDEETFYDIDLIKIDVQGAEHLVLQGAKETLKNTKLVFTEFSFKPLYNNSSVFSKLYDMLYESGFILAEISQGHRSAFGELLQGDALFLNKKHFGFS